jgi:hypothetical protein
VSKRLSRRNLFLIGVTCAVTLALAIWFAWSGSLWPIGLALAGLWAVSLVYRRDAGVLFWLFFVASSVPVVVYLLGYGGDGLLVIFVVLNAVAMAVGRPSRAAHGSA